MKKTNLYLVVALVVQLILAVIVYYQSIVQSDRQPDLLLSETIQTNLDKISGFEISDNDDNKLTLSKIDNQWLINGKIKANSQKIIDLVDKLKALKASWPISTTPENHKRFEVAENDFVRKVNLTINDKTESFYIGSSPGYRQVHTRSENDENVYAVKLNSFDFPVEVNDWLDNNQLSLKDSTIEKIFTQEYTIEQKDSSWTLTQHNRAEGTVINLDQAKKLNDTLINLSLLGFAEDMQFSPTYELTISVKQADDVRSLKYAFAQKDKDFYVKISDHDNAFQISENDYQTLTALPILEPPPPPPLAPEVEVAPETTTTITTTTTEQSTEQPVDEQTDQQTDQPESLPTDGQVQDGQNATETQDPATDTTEELVNGTSETGEIDETNETDGTNDNTNVTNDTNGTSEAVQSDDATPQTPPVTDETVQPTTPTE